MERIVLITNIAGVNVFDVRLHAHAVILQDKGNADDGPRYRCRGFHTHATLPIFDMLIPSLEYDFEREPSPPWIGELGGRVLSTHGRLRIRREGIAGWVHDGIVEMILDCRSQDGQEIDFEHIEGDPARDREFFPRLWARLHAKVAHYWREDTMPVVDRVRVELIRRAYPVEVRR